MLPFSLLFCVAQVMAGEEGGDMGNARLYLTHVNNGSIKML